MKPSFDEALARDVSKRIGAPVANRAALDALPATVKFNGQRRTVLSDYSDWVYRSTTDDWVPSTAGGGPGPDYVQEWTNPAAVSTTALKAATATTVAPQTILAAAMLTQGKADLAAYPRTITFTVGGGSASDAPTVAHVTGTDIDGNALTEDVSITASAGTYESTKCFKTFDVTYGAATGTGATIAIGLGGKLGLGVKPKVRAGGVAVRQEISSGAVVTNGAFATPTTSPPYGSYAPNSAPNGTRDYAVYFERDLS